MDSLFEESVRLNEELVRVLQDQVLVDDSEQARVAYLSCSLSIEHWHAVRVLLESALLPAALVVHRAQFEALTRCVWLTYAASEENIAKFSQDLSLDSEQATKNAPLVERMLQQIELKAPRPAFDGLTRFKNVSWRALNSYVHAGIHPLRRHESGYPVQLVKDALCNANGLAVFSFMQAVVLCGAQPLQAQIMEVADRYPDCMPQRL